MRLVHVKNLCEPCFVLCSWAHSMLCIIWWTLTQREQGQGRFYQIFLLWVASAVSADQTYCDRYHMISDIVLGGTSLNMIHSQRGKFGLESGIWSYKDNWGLSPPLSPSSCFCVSSSMLTFTVAHKNSENIAECSYVKLKLLTHKQSWIWQQKLVWS